MEKWLSVAQLSKQARVPESTARRYLTRFERFFRYEDRQRGRRYEPQSVPILVFIQNCYGEGMEAEEIEDALAKQFPFTVSTTEPPQAFTQPPTPMIATKDDLASVLAEIRAVREEMTTIREENASLHRILDERLVERDKRLMEAMQLIMQTRKEIAASNEKQVKKRWYEFWK